MIKCKKYCQYKAVDIYKSLKKGEVPKRGGPKEQDSPPSSNLKSENLSNNIDNNNPYIDNNNPFIDNNNP